MSCFTKKASKMTVACLAGIMSTITLAHAQTDTSSQTPAASDASGNKTDESSTPAKEFVPKGTDGKVETAQPEKAEKPAPEPIPESLENRLWMAATVSLGQGKVKSDRISLFSSDRMGAGFSVGYSLPASQGQGSAGSAWYTGLEFFSFTGVDHSAKDLSIALQNYILFAGYDIPLTAENDWRVKGDIGVGLGRVLPMRQADGKFVKGDAGFAGSLRVHAVYRFWEKLFVQSGVQTKFGKNSWFGADFGVGGSF